MRETYPDCHPRYMSALCSRSRHRRTDRISSHRSCWDHSLPLQQLRSSSLSVKQSVKAQLHRRGAMRTGHFPTFATFTPTSSSSSGFGDPGLAMGLAIATAAAPTSTAIEILILMSDCSQLVTIERVPKNSVRVGPCGSG